MPCSHRSAAARLWRCSRGGGYVLWKRRSVGKALLCALLCLFAYLDAVVDQGDCSEYDSPLARLALSRRVTA